MDLRRQNYRINLQSQMLKEKATGVVNPLGVTLEARNFGYRKRGSLDRVTAMG
jgi:hypothetical protein